ncbi:hypothetical protein LZC95_50425 [Pendulispora brunnea]|uniref:Uncharacterized protein n=1 Tax=Pendulispora brunnea TaxID=2905690 RepID=A0ABZ2K7F5_9BACT
MIVRAGSSRTADYLLLLEKGAWARPRPVIVPSDGSKVLTYDIEPLEPEEVIDGGWQLDRVVDAAVEAFTLTDGDCESDDIGDVLHGARAEGLVVLLSVARLPGVVALRRRTEESRLRFLISLGLSRSNLRGRGRHAGSFLEASAAYAALDPAND